mmetsp:Transcript_16035/g.28498  ORF Transcript_16035/g.28498 Transcript_16035/m.28498 type:complete len:282 (-) Transcript_16035:365-1210(-)
MSVRRRPASTAAATKSADEQQVTKDAAKVQGSEAEEGPYTDRVLQVLLTVVSLGLFGVLMAVEKVSLEEVLEQLYSALRIEQAKTDLGYLHNERFWITAAMLSTPHVFYFFTWTNAKTFHWMTKCLGEPYKVFAKLGHLIKLFQAVVTLVYFMGEDRCKAMVSDPKEFAQETLVYAQSLNSFQALLGLELLALGQLFNMAVYSQIGEAGVYYGCRLGQDVPWVYGFPFSTVPHPQYLGTVLSIFGLAVLLCTPAAVSLGIYGMTGVMTIYYAFSSYVEANL